MGFLGLDYGGGVVMGNSEISSTITWRAGQTGIAGLQITFPESVGLKCDLRFAFCALIIPALKRKCFGLLNVVGALSSLLG